MIIIKKYTLFILFLYVEQLSFYYRKPISRRLSAFKLLSNRKQNEKVLRPAVAKDPEVKKKKKKKKSCFILSLRYF
jgi:hypothetical protein